MVVRVVIEDCSSLFEAVLLVEYLVRGILGLGFWGL